MTSPSQIEVGPMPWFIQYGHADCGDDQWAVVRDADGFVEGCHDTRADAVTQQQALYAAEPEAVPTVDAVPLAAAALVNDGPKSGAMVAFLPTVEDAERLALEGYEPADQLHVTSLYLGDASEMDDFAQKRVISDVAAAMAGVMPFSAEAFAVSAFSPTGDQPCLTLGLSGDALAMAQAAVAAGAGMHAAMTQHMPWHAHMTLAYDTDPYLMMGQDTNDRLGPINFDRVRVVFAGNTTDIPLGPGPQGVDEPVDDMEMMVAAAIEIPPGGTPWTATLVIEGVWSGDGRQFAPDSLIWAPLPLPLKWQPAEKEGHEGAVIVGRIDTIERVGNAIVATGVFDDAGVNGAEALRLVRAVMLRGISLCADDIDETDIELIYEIAAPPMMPEAPEMVDMPVEGEPVDPEVFHMPGKHNQKDHGGGGGMKWTKEQLKGFDKKPKPLHSDEAYRKRFGGVEGAVTADGAPELDVIVDEPADMEMMELPEPKKMFHAGRIRSATLVAEAAWVESELVLGDAVPPAPTRVEMPMSAAGGGWTITIPELWPEEWFDEPAPEDMPEFGGLRITASGRITGWLAPPDVVHRAFRSSGRSVTVPTQQDYSEFNNKAALVAARDGGVAKINAGNITFNCGHVDLNDPVRASGSRAVRDQYENTCSIVARVRIWESPRYPGAPVVAGALLHGVDADAIERMMGCNLSGDWQGGRLNAALLVPVEGFPPAVQGSVRVREGQLVASSVPLRFEPRVRDQIEALARRIGLDHESQFARLRTRVDSQGR